MRTKKTIVPSTSSDRRLSLTCPASWGELSQLQLRYVLSLIGSDLYDNVQVRTLMFTRFCNINIIRKCSEGQWKCWTVKDGRKFYFDLLDWQVVDAIKQLDYVNRPEDMDVRLESIQGFSPVDALLHGLPFIDYLNLEAAYQGWLQTRQDGRVVRMARILYRDKDGEMPEKMELDIAEQTGTLFWYYHIKSTFAKYFPNFFRPVTTTGAQDQFRMLEAINAQIRALTDGDITKENEVKHADCWRALTELDAKAREAEEFKRKYGNK